MCHLLRSYLNSHLCTQGPKHIPYPRWGSSHNNVFLQALEKWALSTFWMCLWGCIWKRLASVSADWVKWWQIRSLVYEPRSHIRLLLSEAKKEKKKKTKKNTTKTTTTTTKQKRKEKKGHQNKVKGAWERNLVTRVLAPSPPPICYGNLGKFFPIPRLQQSEVIA